MVDAASLFYRIDPQHLVNASLAVLFIESVDDAQHGPKSPIHLMKAAPLLFRARFMALAIWFRSAPASHQFPRGIDHVDIGQLNLVEVRLSPLQWHFSAGATNSLHIVQGNQRKFVTT
ncbi:hypothetical protein [Bradyrhizobium canariense]|uniref:hypothetical protein n=1 Tax=Bradyrhizobium canariense TaxID=255045 RepID=UPI000A18D0AE|nr:hypothetical protein [Bradyrhizobium canariense]OSI41140.1 hypothetical protein BST66_00405 [Bradyrhizobium canariense]OSI57974.1 hypothetical protein BSZ20_00435 [Bradyrhizobium canariense]